MWGKKVIPAAAAPMIWFSQAKKRKHVRINEMEKPHLQLLLQQLDFLKQKTETRSGGIRWKSLTCSYCSHDKILLSEKAKSCQDMRRKIYTCSCSSYDTVFVSKKGKSSQEVWDRKAPPAATAPTIQFSQEKKQNQVRMYVMKRPHLQLLLLRYGCCERKSKIR